MHTCPLAALSYKVYRNQQSGH